MIKQAFILTWVLFSLIVLSACEHKQATQSLYSSPREAIVTIQPTPTFPPYSDGDLDTIQSQIGGLLDELQLKYSIATIGWGVGQDHIEMMIRKFGDFEQPITMEEQQGFRQSLYTSIGKEFPLRLDINSFSGDGFRSGKIEKVEKDRVLIVNRHEKNGNTDDTQTTYVSLTKDSKIYSHGNTKPQTFGKLAVGQEVRFWITGVVKLSYPSQSTALKIEIMD